MGEVVPLRSSNTSPDIREFIDSWVLHLDQQNLSHGTIRSYTDTVKMAGAWLAEGGHPSGVDDIQPEHLRAFLVARKDATSPATAAKDYRNLSVFWGWCVREGERTGPNPMKRIAKPKAPPKAHKIFTDDDLAKLLKTCSGSNLEDRRDLAIIRILIDNGVRVSGLAGLRYTPNEEDTHDVYPSRHRIRVQLKGGRTFWAPIGKRAAAALDRYIRARARVAHPDNPWLWLPMKGTRDFDAHLTASGIAQMLERRGEQAGLKDVRPHKFRRTFASTWEGDSMQLMDIGGWESLEMVRHYSRARREERAREAHAELAPGDRI